MSGSHRISVEFVDFDGLIHDSARRGFELVVPNIDQTHSITLQYPRTMTGSKIQRWVRALRKRVSVGWKFCLSLRKTTWELNDYPVGLREQAFSAELAAPRFKQCRYRAYIENGTLIGEGETSKEAMSDLAVRFEETRAERNRKGTPSPRPEIREPIEFACQDRVNQHHGMADDFVRRVLNLEWAWISDDSSLWDFHFLSLRTELCLLHC